ncbi:hypothetical protein [Phenylobacterium sp. J426]|uniref:hypothetical protein n=1 Tax=Phenylobacterium sp. J426 TaxID=2898439 RepID=UPI0027E3A5AA|nr:hypothetical protein [Phenylobacterium sp. J426]
MDERFCRMWEFYLGISEMAFRHRGHFVFQVQLAKQTEALPITRDYMAEAEAKLGQARRAVPPRARLDPSLAVAASGLAVLALVAPAATIAARRPLYL